MRARLAFAGLGAAALIAGGYWAGAANVPSSHATAAQPQVARPATVQTLPDFTTIVEGNKAAVVNITSTMKANGSGDENELGGLDENDPLYEFFRPFPR